MVEVEDRGIDICFSGDKSADLRTELGEADQDYTGERILEQEDASTDSESENDTPLRLPTELPHLSPEKSPQMLVKLQN